MDDEKMFACGLAVGLRAAAALIRQHFQDGMSERERAAWRIDPGSAAHLLPRIWEMADDLNAFGECAPRIVYADAEIASWANVQHPTASSASGVG